MRRDHAADESDEYQFARVPAIGAMVHLVLDNSKSKVLQAAPTFEIRGKVVALPYSSAPDEFGVWVQTDPLAPMRGVRLSRVLTLNGRPVRRGLAPLGDAPTPSQRSRVVDVQGSKGTTYKVRIDSSGDKTCTCPGFGFRRTCRHIAEVK